MSRQLFRRTVGAVVAAVVLGSDLTSILATAPFDSTVTADFIPNAAIPGANTNTRKIDIVNKGQNGAGTTVAASLQFNAGVNGVAFVPKVITPSGVDGATAAVAGDVIVAVSTHIGTGQADPGGLFRVTFTRKA